MGYYMSVREENFKIKKENFDAALSAMKKAVSKGRWGWVDTEDVIESKTLQEAMAAVNWPLYIVTEKDVQTFKNSSLSEMDIGDAHGISFDGEKSGDEDTFFGAIAPYVESGSYIEMTGEDNEIWRWSFKNGKCLNESSIIVWEDWEAIIHAMVERIEEYNQLPLFLKIHPALDEIIQNKLKTPTKKKRGKK